MEAEDCDLLIERLSRELVIVKDQLAVLTHGLDIRLDPPFPCDSSTHSSRPVSPSHFLPQLTASPVSTKHLRKLVRKVTKPPPVSKSPTITTPTKFTLRKLLDIVDEKEREREELNKRYLTLMKVHIEQQLNELRKKEAVMAKARERRRRKERALRLQLKPPRFRSTGADNKDYLVNVYQSALYQAVELEHNLKKSGKLQTHAELKSFWDYIMKPESPSTTEKIMPTHTQEQMYHPPPLLNEGEEEEEERIEGSYTNSWAITAQPPDVKKQGSSSIYTGSKSSLQTPSMNFTHDKLPKLRAVQEILGEPIKKKYDIQQRQGSKWEGQLRIKRRQVLKAYQQAKANEITMRSLFPHLLQNLDDDFSTPSPTSSHLPPLSDTRLAPPCDMHSTSPFTHITPSAQFITHLTITSLPTLPSIRHLQPLVPTSASGEDMLSSTERCGRSDRGNSEEEVEHCHGDGAPRSGEKDGEERKECVSSQQVALVPLTMASLMQNSKVLETKTKKNTMWKNYLFAGT